MGSRYEHKYDAVADIYDIYVNIASDIPFWIKEAKKYKEVLELTSGTGRITIPLACAGIKITALDISSKLLDELKKKAKKEKLKIDVLKADMRNFSLDKKFPLIIIPFNSIQEITNPKDHVKIFRNVNRHMNEGGMFIVTTHNTDGNDKSESKKMKLVGTYPGKKDGSRMEFWNCRSFDPKTQIGTSLQLYKEFNANGNMARKRSFRNKYYVFKEKEFENLVAATGFKIRQIYGDYSFGKYSKKSPFRIYELVK